MKKFGVSLALIAILSASAIFVSNAQAQRPAPPRHRGHEVIVINHGRPAPPPPHHGRPAPPPPPHHHGHPAPPPPPHHGYYAPTWGGLIGGIIDAAIHESHH